MLFGSFIFILVYLGCLSKGELSHAEKAKLDPALQNILFQNKVEQKKDVEPSSGSVKNEWDVIIRTSDVKALKKLNLRIHSAFGEIVTARVTRKQILKIVTLPSVKSVELGSTNYPQ